MKFFRRKDKGSVFIVYGYCFIKFTSQKTPDVLGSIPNPSPNKYHFNRMCCNPLKYRFSKSTGTAFKSIICIHQFIFIAQQHFIIDFTLKTDRTFAWQVDLWFLAYTWYCLKPRNHIFRRNIYTRKVHKGQDNTFYNMCAETIINFQLIYNCCCC